jgi:prevent-host-death family protein
MLSRTLRRPGEAVERGGYLAVGNRKALSVLLLRATVLSLVSGDVAEQQKDRRPEHDYHGLMRTASVSETKARLSALLDLVRAGETVTITDRGRPVARLVPAVGRDEGDDEARLQRLERAGLIRRPKERLDIEAFLAQPKAKSRESVLEALLEERRESDR